MGSTTLGKVWLLSTLSYSTSLPPMLPLTLRPNLLSEKLSLCFPFPQSFYSDDSLIPCSSASLSGLLTPTLVGLYDLCPWTLMSLPHLQPLFFLLSLLGFLRLWRQKQCPVSSPFLARFLLWTIPSSSSFSGLTDTSYHYLVFEDKRGIF